jgi:16S rRNA (cytosine967-C5)-methyltransferase
MTARETALRILLAFEKDKPRLDHLLDSQFKESALSAKERKFVSNLVSGVIRFRSLLDWKAASLFKGSYKSSLNYFKLILCLALYELDHLDFIPPHATLNEYVDIAKKKLPAAFARTVNGILRTYLRIGKSLDPEKKFKYPETQLSLKYAFPEWLIKRWLDQWDREFVEDMCRAMNERPTFDLRIHTAKISMEDFKERLATAQIAYSDSAILADVLKITDMQNLQQSGLLKSGLCSVQDESGLLAVQLLEAGNAHSLLDICAAPGSKLTAIMDNYPDLHVTALELKSQRILKVRENCRRLGLREAYLVVGDATIAPFPAESYDHILVDAPCSGLGTIQKHPDIKWRRTLEEIFTFQRLQLQIMDEVKRLLKPGGILVYCTCTVDPSENEQVIQQFMARAKDMFRIIPPPPVLTPFLSEKIYLRTFPHKHAMEGSFAVKLQKIRAEL